MREALIQSGIINALYEHGFTCFPCEFKAQRGCPDLVVFREDFTQVVWLEVKTPVGVLSEHQRLIHAVLRNCGQFVGVVTNTVDALNFCSRVFYGEAKDRHDVSNPQNLRQTREEKDLPRVRSNQD